jgi:beta-phosphoglucomutase-like phosphatase (HAD superfamily)
MRLLGVPAARVVTFEDTPGGITSALGAGVAAIGVATSYTSARLKRAGACAVVPDLGAVDGGALLDGRPGALRSRTRKR